MVDDRAQCIRQMQTTDVIMNLKLGRGQLLPANHPIRAVIRAIEIKHRGRLVRALQK